MREVLEDFVTAILGCAVFAVMLFSFGCGGGNSGGSVNIPDEIREAAQQNNGSLPVAENPQRATPGGVTIHGDPALSQEQMLQIDAGIDRTLADAAISGMNKDARSNIRSFYHVYLPTNGCHPAPESGVPAFIVRGDKYDGTYWDQYNSKGPNVPDGIGVIYAPERVFLNGSPGDTENGRPAWRAKGMICPSGDVYSFVRFYVEHAKIRNEDNEYYEATKIQVPPHPLLPKP